jgi:predicted esterase
MSQGLAVLADFVCVMSMVCVSGTSGCSSSSSNDVTGNQASGGASAGIGGVSASSGGATAGTGGTAASSGGTLAATGGVSTSTGGGTGTATDGGVYLLPVDAGQSGFMTWTYNGQPVGFYLPAQSDKPLPVVMFLHGCGNDPVNPNWWIIAALNKIEPCAVLLPFRPQEEGCSAWGGTYDDALRPAMVDALAGLDSVIERFDLDSKRQYLYGESMGAEGILELLVQFPARFAGAVPVASYTLDKGAQQMAKTPLWLVQGSADTVNPSSSVETIYQSILDAGGTQVKFTEYQGMDHVQSIIHARTQPCLLEWLLAQLHDGIMRPGSDCDAADAGSAGRVTVTLDVTNIDAAYEGKSVTIKLMTGVGDCTSSDAPAYAATGTVAAGACTVSIEDVPEDTYTACGFIDVDGDSQPSHGDLVSQLPFWVSGDTTETWNTSDWVQI